MMHNPPHPGEVLKEDVIAPLGLSVTEADQIEMDIQEDAELNRIADERANSRELPVSFDEL
jgi:plasmid maintenance system antidote protein VapI